MAEECAWSKSICMQSFKSSLLTLFELMYESTELLSFHFNTLIVVILREILRAVLMSPLLTIREFLNFIVGFGFIDTASELIDSSTVHWLSSQMLLLFCCILISY